MACNRLTSVKTLIEHGASPNVKDNEGQTPLDVTKVKKYEEIIKEFAKVSFLFCC